MDTLLSFCADENGGRVLIGESAHVVPRDHSHRWCLAAGKRKVFVLAALSRCLKCYFEILLAQNGEWQAPYLRDRSGLPSRKEKTTVV